MDDKRKNMQLTMQVLDVQRAEQHYMTQEKWPSVVGVGKEDFIKF